MEKYTDFILKYKKSVVVIFLLSTILSVFLATKVKVDYNFADYLPEDAQSTLALDTMNAEYAQSVTNMRVMINDVTIPEALEIKKEIAAIKGVEEINWLDDAVNIYEPLEYANQEIIDTWYQDQNALFTVTMDETNGEQVMKAIREIIGDENHMSGTAVTNALAPTSTTKDVQKIILIVIPICFLILLLTTNSWFEPVLFMITIGVAIMLNRGTNLMFGTISFVTNAAGSVLQLAVSMDYAVFLLHRFTENRQEGKEIKDAMACAVRQSMGSVLSSGLTTVSGFAALILMRFRIGPDMGWVMAKAIVLSLLCVLCFLPSLTVLGYKMIDHTMHRPLIPPFHRFAALVKRLCMPVTVIVLLLVVPCILGQQKNDFLYGGSEVYSTEETQLGRDMIAIEEAYGTSNPLVLLVPKGNREKEIALNRDLKNLDCVTSVISYVNSVGETIPEEFIPADTLAKLYSDNYSRFVVSIKASEATAGWDEMVDTIRKTGQKYFGEQVLLAGDLASTQDLKTTIIQDTAKVNLLAIGFVFVILLFNFKSISLPVILTLVIEASIWINLAVPYLQNMKLYYIGYLIISSVQLGATIDYGILLTDRYLEYRRKLEKKQAMRETIISCSLSILTSGSILTAAGFALGKISTNGVLSQLGIMIGRGVIISVCLVLFVLPALLLVCDGLIEKTTWKTEFYRQK